MAHHFDAYYGVNTLLRADSIAAKPGYTLTSLGREDVTLNGKAPVNSFYEDGIFLCLTYELDSLDSTDTPGGSSGGSNTPETPKKGLSGGEVAGIVVGCVAVIVGGFAIFWFVIKKKSFADLVAVFKKKY